MRHACVVCGASTIFSITYHGSRGLPIEEESGGSGCECNRGREGEAEEEQESSIPGTKEKGNRRGAGWLAGGFICSAPLASLESDSVCVCVCVSLHLPQLDYLDQLSSEVASSHVHRLM